MFRPSAKLVSFLALVVFLLIGSLFIGFYTHVSLDNAQVINGEQINLEKGSLANRALLDFYVKAKSGNQEYQNYLLKIKESLGPYKGKFAVNKNISFDLKTIENKCSKEGQCSQINISLSEISSNVWRALVGIEDSRFLAHQGIDWFSILRAMYVNIIAGKIVQGGSTLTQQLSKNLFLSTERTFSRKFKEAFYSLVLEVKYSKLQIIEQYLNNVYWGSFLGLKIYGIKAASLFYFDKHPLELDEFEAAILIGMLKGPSLYSPFNKNKINIQKRSNLIFQKLIRDGYFTGVGGPWNDSKWNNWLRKNFEENYFLLKSINGLQVSNFYNFILKYYLERKVSFLNRSFPQGEFNYHLVGLKEKRIRTELYSNYSVKKLPKNIGSLLKPVVYSELFKKFSKDDIFSTDKIKLHLKSGVWEPSDHYDEREFVTLQFALEKSLNIPFIRAVEKFGFDEIESLLVGKINNLKRPLAEYPAQLLGAIELPVEDVLILYSDFLSSVCNDQRVANVVNILSQPSNTTTSRWTGVLKDSLFFGKTGTSNNGYDNWYVFYDYRDLYVLWIGHAGSRDVGSLALSGAGVSFTVIRDFLTSRAKNIGQNFCDD